MTSNTPPAAKSTYTQGHSPEVLKSHQARNVNNSAAFLLPQLQPHFHLLDIGCGPGTITASFASLLPSGSVTGIDIAAPLVSQNKTTFPADEYPNLTFEVGNVIDGLRFDDANFDVIFTNQTILHIPEPVKAIKEAHRLLKTDGMLAMRESDSISWYPALPGLTLYTDTLQRMVNSTGGSGWYRARGLHGWAREAGFDREKMKVTVSGDVSCSTEERERNAEIHVGRLKGGVGEKFRELGLVKDGDIEVMVRDLERWRDDVDGWFVVWQCEVIARK